MTELDIIVRAHRESCEECRRHDRFVRVTGSLLGGGLLLLSILEWLR